MSPVVTLFVYPLHVSSSYLNLIYCVRKEVMTMMKSCGERSIIKDIYDHFDELSDGFLPRTKEYGLTKAQNNKLEHEFCDL